jgi:F-type H+-transporting ATPase subunit gamma
MPTLKEVQTKIGSIKKTKQITKAMNMVAASRLRGAQNAMEAFRPFAGKFAEVLGSLSEKAGEDASPLLTPKETVKKIHIILCTSDRGLCGGFNMSLINTANKFMKEKKAEGKEVVFTNFGKKGRDWCKSSGLQIENAHLNVVGSTFGFNVAQNAGKTMIDGFLAGDWDEVYIVWSNFIGMGKQVPILQQILPIPPIEADQEKDINAPYQAEHICEPSPDELLGEMLPRNVYIQIHSGLLETSTSEHAARMMAMDNASKACNDMIDELTLLFNKARQAAITADLMDIVGGAEALKG